MWFFNRNKTSDKINTQAHEPLFTDIHSHLLAGIDDGSASISESLIMIESMMDMGYKNFVTTPHVMQGAFDNNPSTIGQALVQLRAAIQERQLDVRIEAAAEYYFDSDFFSLINSEAGVLSFGKPKYVLFELPVVTLPYQLHEIVVKLISKGYTPVLAHPERYHYLSENYELAHKWVKSGLLLQVNLMSLAGHYSKQSKVTAQWLIDQKLVHFAGTDCHRPKHIEIIKRAKQEPYYKKLMALPLLNDTLFD